MRKAIFDENGLHYRKDKAITKFDKELKKAAEPLKKFYLKNIKKYKAIELEAYIKQYIFFFVCFANCEESMDLTKKNKQEVKK